VTAYARYRLDNFLSENVVTVIGTLQTRYSHDGFASQYTQQTKAWERFVPLLQAELSHLIADRPEVGNWGILLEYPLYRLRKRIDAIILAANKIIVLEVKVGEFRFHAEDERQVEDYALDLRDFHAGCRGHRLIPILWCTNASICPEDESGYADMVAPVQRAGAEGLRTVLGRLVSSDAQAQLVLDEWDAAPYKPVPTIIEAATSIFAGHDVRAIACADASNLAVSAGRIVEIISEAKRHSLKALVFLTGVPGAGKTLAGLQVVHDAVTTGAEDRGDIVYLSGNTPLVVVLREALARDIVCRKRAVGIRSTFADERRLVRTRIQHINDYLREYLTGTESALPHEHAIVFDEAQRAWDADQGARKFERQKSEPSLLLEIMDRHSDWCVCVCLVGGGQEINTGEEGIKGWGDALRNWESVKSSKWTIHGPEDVFHGGTSTGGLSLGELPSGIVSSLAPDLRLSVPLRSYRSPAMSEWVTAVLESDLNEAKSQSAFLAEYPIVLTRSLESARAWLRERGRGERRFGLLASSGARRLRADGLGEILEATHGSAIAQWYLNGRDDIRSSCVLEVPANEYACQGLEIDFSCVCWGGDLIFAPARSNWLCRRLSGNAWNEIRSETDRRYVHNTYRVLLTRAREGIVIWVPGGDQSDLTRKPEELDATAAYLVAAGARMLGLEDGVP
jgi:Uncharacterized conserved protein (DUF2075)